MDRQVILKLEWQGGLFTVTQIKKSPSFQMTIFEWFYSVYNSREFTFSKNS